MLKKAVVTEEEEEEVEQRKERGVVRPRDVIDTRRRVTRSCLVQQLLQAEEVEDRQHLKVSQRERRRE